MAARHLQRLRAALDEKIAEEHPSSEDDVVVAKAPFNPFDLLSDEEVKMSSACCCPQIDACKCHASLRISEPILVW